MLQILIFLLRTDASIFNKAVRHLLDHYRKNSIGAITYSTTPCIGEWENDILLGFKCEQPAVVLYTAIEKSKNFYKDLIHNSKEEPKKGIVSMLKFLDELEETALTVFS